METLPYQVVDGLGILFIQLHQILAMFYCLISKIEKIQSTCNLEDRKGDH